MRKERDSSKVNVVSVNMPEMVGVPPDVEVEEEKVVRGVINIPKLSLEDYEVPVDNDLGIKNEVDGAVEYAFVGLGECGGRQVQELYKIGYKKSICINTSSQDLIYCDIPENQKFLCDIGAGGAGKDQSRGESAVVKYSQEIYDLMKRTFGNNPTNIILVAGASGGSGGGGLIPMIMIAKKYLRYLGHVTDLEKRVGVMLTLPTDGESTSLKVATNAFELSEKVSSLAEEGHITPLMIIDNDKIKRLYKGLPVARFWPTVNQSVAGLFDIFNRLAVQYSQYSNFDPTDYRTVIEAGGHCIMGVTTVRDITSGSVDETKISTAIRTNLEKTLLADGFQLTSATVAASIVVGGVKMFETVNGLYDAIEYSFDTLASMTDQATIHRGIYQDNSDVLKVYTIIGGLKRPKERYARLATFARESYPG
jgi:cell division GTPase FtsZ